MRNLITPSLNRRLIVGGLVGASALSVAGRAIAGPGGLVIHHGSPHWWLSKDIWLAKAPSTKSSPPVANPIAGTPYDVWVRVTNTTKETLSTPLLVWNLQVVWAYPFGGSIPLSALPAGDNLTSIGLDPIAGGKSVEIKCTNTWKPLTGHECIVAWTNASNIPYPSDPFLDGDAGPDQSSSIAQHNFSVLSGAGMIHFGFQICNGADQPLGFVVGAEQGALQEIEELLPGLPGGRAVLDRLGKVERLGIVAGDNASQAELRNAPAELKVEIAARSCQAFTLGGFLPSGNALINITQTRDQRVVGGLSVLAMADA